jgi:hypothetical protein
MFTNRDFVIIKQKENFENDINNNKFITIHANSYTETFGKCLIYNMIPQIKKFLFLSNNFNKNNKKEIYIQNEKIKFNNKCKTQILSIDSLNLLLNKLKIDIDLKENLTLYSFIENIISPTFNILETIIKNNLDKGCNSNYYNNNSSKYYYILLHDYIKMIKEVTINLKYIINKIYY